MLSLQWVGYHYEQGAHRLYVMDNGSEQPLNATIPDWIDAGVVHYEYWTLQRGDLIPGDLRIVDAGSMVA